MKQIDLTLGRVDGIRPLFVSSLYRSSSTFLSAVIGCHPEYTATSSSVKFLRFCLGRYGDVRDPANLMTLIDETHKRVSTRWGINFDRLAILDKVKARGSSYAILYDAIMSQILNEQGALGTRWIEKVAVMWSKIPEFLTMFPEGKVIHVLRDPRSVTASYKKMTYEVAPTYLDAAFNTVHAIQSIEKFQRDIGTDRVMLVRSEDIAADPKGTLLKICDFLEIDFSGRMMDPEKYGNIIGEDWRTNTSFRGSISGFPPASTRWRDSLLPAETLFVEMITQPYLSKYGYEPESNFPTRDEWAEIFEYLQDPFIKSRFETWIKTGEGSEGYRTDPYITEMKIVFPERFEGGASGDK